MHLTSFNTYLYFSAYTHLTGRELFRTQGGMGQAELVHEESRGINPGSYLFISVPALIDAWILLIIRDMYCFCETGIEDSSPEYLTVVGDFLVFSATNILIGREIMLMGIRTEGMDSNELRHIDLVQGPTSSNPGGYCASEGMYITSYRPLYTLKLMVLDTVLVLSKYSFPPTFRSTLCTQSYNKTIVIRSCQSKLA